MKLHTRPDISSGFVIAILLGCASMAHLRIRQNDRVFEDATTAPAAVAPLTRGILFAPAQSVRALESSMLFGSDAGAAARFLAERRDAISAGELAFSRLLDPARHLSAAETVRVRELQATLVRLRALEEETERLNSLQTPEGTSQANDLLQKQVLPLDQLLFTSVNDFITSHEATPEDTTARLRRADRSLATALWTASILGAILAGLMSFLRIRHTNRSMQLLSERADAMASGILTGAPLAIPSNDQFAPLAEAIQQVEQRLAHTMETVAEASTKLASGAVSMRSACEQARSRAEKQTGETLHAAGSVKEIAISISEAARQTHSAGETAHAAVQTAREGSTMVCKLLDALRLTRCDLAATADTVALIDQDSRRIAQLTAIIGEITRQTNLLALNAQIEAGRAGEQGRGFAVIGAEVRRLAEATATSTSEIAATVQAIQSRTGTAAAGLRAATTSAALGASAGNQAGDAVERLTLTAERVEQMITRIAVASVQQAAAANQSSGALVSILTLSTENLDHLAATATGLDSLHRGAARLERQLDRFLPGKPPAPFAAHTSAAQADATAAGEAIQALRASFSAA